MLHSFENATSLTALLAAATLVLAGCGKSEDSGARFTPVGEVREVRGTVADAKLTVCGPTPGKPGNCEGTLVVEVVGPEGPGRVPVEITRDVALTKDGQAVFLPQLRGSQVTVKYRVTEEGPNLATSVTAP